MPADTPGPDRPFSDGLSRRRILGLAAGAAGVAAAGTVGYRLGHRSVDTAAGSTDASTTTESAPFRSRPDLAPPPIQITHTRAAAQRRTDDKQPAPYFFLAPKAYSTKSPMNYQVGPMITDRNGNIVWFSPSTRPIARRAMDFRVQTYRGEQVLTWYEGKSADGYGKGTAKIVDTHYRTIATIEAHDGLKVDLHEFVITERDTALITAYRTSTVDLTGLGGSSSGKILSGVVQEIDIATEKLIFSWDSLDHVRPAMTYKTVVDSDDALLDYFHINSIDEIDEHTLLIPSRNTWAVYLVDKRTGKIIWRLGGRKSDFVQHQGTHFYYQHAASMVGKNRVLLFDNGASPRKEKQSRALLLQLHHQRGTVELVRAITHPAKLLAVTMGNVTKLSNGHFVIGWGSEPYFSEHATDGTMLLDGKFPDNVQTYRAFGGTWTGKPTDKPAIAVGTNTAGGATVYVSWNGATEVAHWHVRAGQAPGKLNHHAKVARHGFETAVAVNSNGPYFQAIARDSNGRELGRSPVRKANI